VWLERASGGDVEALAALEASSFSHPWTERQFRQEVAHEGPGAVVVLRGGRRREVGPDLVGYCAYRVLVDEAHIMTVAGGEPWRRLGLGTWLLRFCLARARREGAARALFEVRAGNEAARAVYARLGFRESGRRPEYYVGPREDAIVLTLEPIPATFS